MVEVSIRGSADWSVGVEASTDIVEVSVGVVSGVVFGYAVVTKVWTGRGLPRLRVVVWVGR